MLWVFAFFGSEPLSFFDEDILFIIVLSFTAMQTIFFNKKKKPTQGTEAKEMNFFSFKNSSFTKNCQNGERKTKNEI